VGPNLYGVAGRGVAGIEGFPYTAALEAKVGETWSNANLDAFLADPKNWAPGTKMTFPGLPEADERAAVIAYLRALPDLAEREAEAKPTPAPAREDNGGPAVLAAEKESRRLVREGLVVDFSLTPAGEGAAADGPVLAGTPARVAFRITDEATGEPVPGLDPGAWADLSIPWGSDAERTMSCRERVGLYLDGSLGVKAQIDLNSYFMLVMNEDATILVFDPLVNVSGSTMLYAQVNLKKPGADWARTEDGQRLFVSMPRADQVAVVDTDVFKVKTNLDAGVHPVRVALQPDERYLWVGNDSREPEESGVTVIDVETHEVAARIPTGAGHHEIAFSDDSRTAFVTNRESGTVSVIDVQKLEKVADVKTGSLPISLAFSSLSKALYVADGRDGVISVLDPASRTVKTRIKAMPGLGPLRFDHDGRWGFVTNAAEDLVHVIDASADRIAQDIQVGTRPYQVTFSRSFAYVRSLGTERVAMVNLEELNKGRKPPVVTFAAGEKAPEDAPELNLADALIEAPGEAAVLVVSPSDSTVYYYMEGMNAPMGAFRNYGHRPLAVTTVDRALRENEPGTYSSVVELPDAGVYDVAFVTDAPQILHCFKAAVRPNPNLTVATKPLAIEYLVESRTLPAGDKVALRFLLSDPATGELRRGLEDVRVFSYRAPVFERSEVVAREVRDGLYEAILPLRRVGAYFVHVSAPSLKVPYGDLPYLSLRTVKPKPPQTTGSEG
jgi:YVTN family beta-propeller protein